MQEAPIQAEHKAPQDDAEKLDELIQGGVARNGDEEPTVPPDGESGGGGTTNPTQPGKPG